MGYNEGFGYVAGEDPLLLILGSMPGVESLKQQQYYAHPRNLFWPLMGEICHFDAALPYPERLRKLTDNRIALWDIAHQCERHGSLDSNIKHETVIANDFERLFETFPRISAIFFNGKKAEQLYRRLVLPTLADSLRAIPLHTLPSTSPAHASLSQEEKLKQWSQIGETLATLKI